jgi:hypothetical protein
MRWYLPTEWLIFEIHPETFWKVTRFVCNQ